MTRDMDGSGKLSKSEFGTAGQGLQEEVATRGG